MNTLVILKNAFFNVVRGSASALVAVLLPPVLTRTLQPDSYSAWVLVLQISAYVALLDFGLQTAVGRFVAHAQERNDAQLRNRIVNTALTLLSAAAMLGLILIGGIAWLLPALFPQMPPSLQLETRSGILLVGASLALSLPFSVCTGIFIGIQRNDIPALLLGGSKLLGGLLAGIFAVLGGDLLIIAIAIAVTNLGGAGAQWFICRKIVPDVAWSRTFVSAAALRELVNYCLTLTIWSLAMLLVSGLDTVIVGVVDYSAVGIYAVAASPVLFLAGLQQAVFAALMPAAAVLGAREDVAKLGRLLMTSTRYGVLLLLLTGLPLIIAAHPLLTLWVGAAYADEATPILQVLVIANTIRLFVVPWVMLLMGTNQQSLVIASPLVEGVVKLGGSIIGVLVFGPIGVALATLLGGLVAVVFNLFYNMPRTRGIAYERGKFVSEALMRPTLCMVPLVLFLPLTNSLELMPAAVIVSGVVALLGTATMIWNVGMNAAERGAIQGAIQNYFARQGV